MNDVDERAHQASDGHLYRVTLSPMERSRGGSGPGIIANVDPIVFEDADGRFVGSAPLYSSVPLWSLTADELEKKFQEALQRHAGSF